jgi:acetyl-CoA synthase
MSKIIATAAIRGSHEIYKRVEGKYNEALKKYGADKKVEFPNTGYFLPVIYGLLGLKVANLGDMKPVFEKCKSLLPPQVADKVWVPYLGHVLDAGASTLFLFEMEEAMKYLEKPPYFVSEDCDEDHLWLGAADDIILRKRGVEFVDGTAPGFAAIVGEAPTIEIAMKIAKQCIDKSLYVFMAGGKFAQQLKDGGMQLGWSTRLVPFGEDTSAAIFALGFATRAALAFGGLKPGDFKNILLYNKSRVFAFVLALDKVTDEKYAAAAGAINYGFPAIAETDIPQILPTGVCTYEHVVSNVPLDEIVERCVEVRGLKVTVTKIDIPVSYGPAYEGERIKKENMRLELGGPKSFGFEFCQMKDMEEVKDGAIEVIGKDIDGLGEGTTTPVAVWVEVAGRKMQEDFEPILERQIHHLLNQAEGILHMGQRDIVWMRITKKAFESGLRLKHLGTILHAKLHNDFGNILDKIQIKIYTDTDKIKELLDVARKTYRKREERMAGLADEGVDTFYSCTLCQSFAPTHVCVVTPERPGLCGAYNWLDCRAAFEINPTGPNQPIPKGNSLDDLRGQWDTVNEFIYQKSGNVIERFNAYSIMEDPMTSCGCFEAITVVLPMTQGFMIVDRDYSGMTPCGMSFSTLAGQVGGGAQTPGFVGMSRQYVLSKKFILAEGGLNRLLWLPKAMKEYLKEGIEKRGAELGIADLYNKIADETSVTTEEELTGFLEKVKHPVLSLEPLF